MGQCRFFLVSFLLIFWKSLLAAIVFIIFLYSLDKEKQAMTEFKKAKNKYFPTIAEGRGKGVVFSFNFN